MIFAATCQREALRDCPWQCIRWPVFARFVSSSCSIAEPLIDSTQHLPRYLYSQSWIYPRFLLNDPIDSNTLMSGSCCALPSYTRRPRSTAKGSTWRSPTAATAALLSMIAFAAWIGWVSLPRSPTGIIHKDVPISASPL
jgi:hypothetical protein